MKNDSDNEKRLYFMGSNPYFGILPASTIKKDINVISRSKVEPVENTKEAHEFSGELFLVDGDNHVYEALKGLGKLSPSDKVKVFATQEGLKNKLFSKFRSSIDVVMVNPFKNFSQKNVQRFEFGTG